MRRRVSAAISVAWWATFARLGLTRERWRALPSTGRRAMKAVVWAAIALLLVRFLGVWQWSALAIAAVVLLLVVPRYHGLAIRNWPVGRVVIPLAALALAITYPYYALTGTTISTGLPQLPIFGTFPQMSTMVNMGIFTMMALGLNFVVGYAGLLDLGYVAYYATVAYTAAFFTSEQFAGQRCPTAGVSIDNCSVAVVLKHSFDFRRVYATMLDGWVNCDSKAVLGGSWEHIKELEPTT